MRDQDLVHRAEVAAAELERAWYCWRSTQGCGTDPMPTVSSYVGYSQQEPWGQPRVIFGIPAEDAEELAGLLARPDLDGPARVRLAGQVGRGHHEPPDGPVFRQVTTARLRAIEGPGVVSDQSGSEQVAVTVPGTLPNAAPGAADVVMTEGNLAGSEPTSTGPAGGSGPSGSGVSLGDAVSPGDSTAGGSGHGVSPGDAVSPGDSTAGGSEGSSPRASTAGGSGGSSPRASTAAADLVGEQLPGLVVAGPWTMAASTARTEAEARIRAYLRGAAPTTGQQAPPAQPSVADKRSADVAVGSDADQYPSDGQDAAPISHARRSRVTRGYQIPKLSRVKRPGAVPGL